MAILSAATECMSHGQSLMIDALAVEGAFFG